MSLSDLFYPGNPEKREKIIRRSQELIELMKSNFEATNSLTEMVNKHLHSSFSPITLDEKATVKENCDVMIERVNQILAKVKEVDEELKKLEPTLYESLQHISLQSFNNIPAADKTAIKSVCPFPAAVLVKSLMKQTRSLIGMIFIFACISNGVIGSILMGLVVGFVITDVVVSGILGYIEQCKLDKALEEYEEALAEFRPASKEYKEAIYEVMFLLKYMKE
ncbi:single-pass membrane and coiled-coil domain-containing protein 3-like [Cyprinus carpio]|uniref:Single-pass membrane and coiled-coil domain-containing protein 3-like n=1 Tax=Cyprinus carpio TaxID=7962 RepID=A0A9Q9ZKE2_CYPCA|nr:single-pass membrane and coiled-coil domain-containing protein 3-like [Cyprinus carpio]